ncbi:MAG TPA: hypothetical protein VNO30_39820 [Kofleriaceae bacterium]|nr:hypothetical protein [Kofleriaceae bacterium]
MLVRIAQGDARRGDASLAGASSDGSGGGGGAGAGFIIVWTPPSGFMRSGVQSPLEVQVSTIE